MAAEPTSDATATSRLSPVALLVAGAFFMENLDGTVIATALPQMAESFATVPAALAVGMTAYLLTLAVFIPASGWAADRFGPRRVFAVAVATFTVASVACGFSNSVWSFTLARIAQGCGGALMTPVGRLVVLRTTAKKDLMRAIATLTWPALVAPVLGPPIGGFITTYSSWRWVFLINVPLGIVAWFLCLRLIGPEPAADKRPFDGIGFLLNGLGLASLLFALDQFGQSGADLRPAGLFLGLSLLLGWLALRHAARHPHPLVTFEAFRDPSFTVTMLGGFVSRTAISTLPFLLPLLFQIGLGLNPFVSGLFVLWYGFANLAIKPWTSPILRRFGFRAVLLGNTAINALSIAACALIGTDTPFWVAAILLMVAGASRSMQFTSINTLAFSELPPAMTGAANTLFNVSFQLAIGMGIACGAIILRLCGALVSAPGSLISIEAFRFAFLAIGTVAALPILDFLRLRPDAGAAVSGHAA